MASLLARPLGNRAQGGARRLALRPRALQLESSLARQQAQLRVGSMHSSTQRNVVRGPLAADVQLGDAVVLASHQSHLAQCARFIAADTVADTAIVDAHT